MERYTIEDVEVLRKKSGISYEEAVNLLEYHNGNLARALVDLERNGRINPNDANTTKTQSHTTHHHQATKKASNFFTRLYRFRMLIKKGDTTITNLSVLFALVAAMISPHLLILSIILILVLGYRVSFDKNSKDFASDNLESMVKNAANNVKETVTSFTKDLGSDGANQKNQNNQSNANPSTKEAENTNNSKNTDNAEKSFYNNSQTPPTPPSQTRPVSVEYQSDSNINIKEDGDGYQEATIE